MMLCNTIRSTGVVFVLLCLAGCSGGMAVKKEVREVMGCLHEGGAIDTTERCLNELSLKGLMIHEREKSYFLLDTVRTACEDKAARNCSSEGFIQYLNVEKQKGFDVVMNPSIQISSHSGNIGGAFVHLVIFFDEKSGEVVGWYNWKPIEGVSFAEE